MRADYALALLQGRANLMERAKLVASDASVAGHVPAVADRGTRLAQRTEEEKIAGVEQLRQFIRNYS